MKIKFFLIGAGVGTLIIGYIASKWLLATAIANPALSAAIVVAGAVLIKAIILLAHHQDMIHTVDLQYLHIMVQALHSAAPARLLPLLRDLLRLYQLKV